MPIAKANGIDIYYETHGERGQPPLLMIMGYGGQLVRWPPKLIALLASRGYHVIVFDNRDVGLSTHFHDAGRADLQAIGAGTATAPYSLDDMADDSAGLLAALEIERAHVLGVSMGGMIAQHLAVRHPAATHSLTSVMSTTGNRELPQPSGEILALLMRPAPRSRDEAIEGAVASDRAIGSQVFPFDEALSRTRAALAYDRAFDPRGIGRQFAAIVTRGDYRPQLAQLSVPTVVVHGSSDPLVLPEGGRDTARSIAGAELVILEGMGHDMPQAVHGKLADAVDSVVARAHRPIS